MYLYIIKCQEFHKIGVANDVESRLAQLSTGNPYPLEVQTIYEFENAEPVERAIHQRYKSVRQRGEWFTLGYDDLKNIHHICLGLGGCAYEYSKQATEDEIKEAEEIGETFPNGARFDFVAMFSDGWWIERSNSKGKREYWVWRKTLETGRDYLYGGRIVDLPKSLEEMQAWRRSIIDGVSVMEEPKTVMAEAK